MIVIHPAGLGRCYLLLQHRYGAQHWGFPKGTTEPGESDWQTAVRELQEETGIAQFVQIPNFRKEIQYQFKQDGAFFDKSVVYFMAAAKDRQVVVSEEHTAYGWFSYAEACEKINHANTRELLEQAESFVNMNLDKVRGRRKPSA